MNNEQALAVFEDFKIRRIYDEPSATWYFSVVDVIAALIQQPNFQAARKYWNKLKERIKNEGSQSVTNCHQLKMVAEDGKMRTTDAASPETLLRLIQSVPSPRAEPIKLWLAKVGYHIFRGDRWLGLHKEDRRNYLRNAYRVLLTRARQGMVIFVPPGEDHDPTRAPAFYDRTFEYLANLGIPVLALQNGGTHVLSDVP